MTDETLTPRQVAKELGVTVRTVQRWVADGRLAATRVGGRVRLSRSSLAPISGSAARRASGIRALLIANRGEIVQRIARTARQKGIRTVGVHTADDRPPDGVDLALAIPGYLDGEALIDAARRAGADAIHPGYGFLAENPDFADAVERAGLAWVGPPATAIAAMGDKAAARRTAAAHGVPVVPGYDDAQDDAALAAAADEVGYPILIKPSAGGGGKGMRVVRDPGRLSDELASARREASRAFGDDRLILERLLEGARHVEVQVLFDAHGHGVHLGERDCSAQRRNQKVIEESPGPSMTAALRERLGAAALEVAAAVGYVSAGTVEFLVTEAGDFFFSEMNTRLQVEHPVTESVTGRDIVADQLQIAAGEALGFAQGDVRWSGHAIEARLYAEDPDAGFLPATGRLLRLRWPDGVPVETGVREGDLVSDRYDPLLAKLIAHGSSRAEALARLRHALEETLVLGVRTNLRFLRWLLDQPVMRDGEVRTDTLAQLSLPPAREPGPAAWSAAAAALLGSPTPDPWGGGWRSGAPSAARLRFGEEERRVEPRFDDAVEIAIEGGVAHLDIEGQSLELALAAPPSVEEAVRHASAHAGGTAALTAPMPGRVIAIRVVEGASVVAHQALVVIEAMKMEHAVVTPLAGTVTRVMVEVGAQVQRGDLLAEVSA